MFILNVLILRDIDHLKVVHMHDTLLKMTDCLCSEAGNAKYLHGASYNVGSKVSFKLPKK